MSKATWNNYSESYNLLSEKMHNSGIDISLLDDVIVAHEKMLKENVPTNPFTNLSNNNPQKVLDIKVKVFT